jgi:hypothetical protein
MTNLCGPGGLSLRHNCPVNAPLRLATAALLLLGAAACGKVQANTPVALALNTPPPPSRIVIPVELPLPEEPAPPPPVAAAPAPAPARARETTARTAQTPVPTPLVTPPVVAESTPAPVLQTTSDTAGLEQKILSTLTEAQRNLDQVNPRSKTFSAEARAQYDRAKGFIRMAQDALKIKNYMYAETLADKAAAVAGLLVKG